MTTIIWKLLKPWNQVHNDYLNHIKVANQNMPTSIYDCIIVIYQHFNASNAKWGLQI
jgi:hypothetical protein